MATPAVGVVLPCKLPASSLVGLAELADEVGLDQVWVVEDCFYGAAPPLAAAVLAGTSRVRVGIGILPAAARNAAFTAMELATLCELYPGRVIAGLGHGVQSWMRQIGAWPGSPLTCLREHLGATRALLAGETVTTAGRYVQLDAVRLERPLEVPAAVLAGVRGPKSLAMAGECADGTILAEPVSTYYLRSAREATGRSRPEHYVVAYSWFAMHERRETALARAAWPLAQSLLSGVGAHLTELPFADELRRLCEGALDARGVADSLPAEWIGQLAVAGTARECADRIRALGEAGADAVGLHLLPGREAESVRAAGEVAGALR